METLQVNPLSFFHTRANVSVFKMRRSEIVKAANVGKNCVCICSRKKVHRFHEYNLLQLIMIIRTIFSSLHVENEPLLLHHRLFIVLKRREGKKLKREISLFDLCLMCMRAYHLLSKR